MTRNRSACGGRLGRYFFESERRKIVVCSTYSDRFAIFPLDVIDIDFPGVGSALSKYANCVSCSKDSRHAR